MNEYEPGDATRYLIDVIDLGEEIEEVGRIQFTFGSGGGPLYSGTFCSLYKPTFDEYKSKMSMGYKGNPWTQWVGYFALLTILGSEVREEAVMNHDARTVLHRLEEAPSKGYIPWRDQLRRMYNCAVIS